MDEPETKDPAPADAAPGDEEDKPITGELAVPDGVRKRVEVPPEDDEAAGAGAAPAGKRQADDELLKTRERMLRMAADFENYRKRSKRDLRDAEDNARIEILKEMLPVFDNLARAVEHGAGVEDLAPIIEGARMVTKQFEENLAKFGLKRIEAVGEFFDPSLHDAIAQEATDEMEPGRVYKEFLAGYTLGDRLLRPALVVVAKPKSES